MTLNKWIVGAVGLALALGIYGVFLKPAQVIDKTTYVDQNGETQVGAIATNEPTEPFYFKAGSTGPTASFMSTTTNVCMFQNPSISTSTFVARWSATAPTTTVTVLAISTSTNVGRFATSTSVLSVTIPANAKGDASYIGANNQNLIGPREWVQIGYGAGTTLAAVAQAQTGLCSVLFGNIR